MEKLKQTMQIMDKQMKHLAAKRCKSNTNQNHQTPKNGKKIPKKNGKKFPKKNAALFKAAKFKFCKQMDSIVIADTYSIVFRFIYSCKDRHA